MKIYLGPAKGLSMNPTTQWRLEINGCVTKAEEYSGNEGRKVGIYDTMGLRRCFAL